MVAAGVAAAVFARLGWPKVLGYMLAGVILSEHTLGGSFLSDSGSVGTIGQLGVVFLMFGMGLSFSPKGMAKVRPVALPAAVIDTALMVWVGYMIGTRLFGWSPVASLFLGVGICDSATTLLAKVIDEKGWTRRPFAKYVMGTSVCEDIVCVGALSVATGFAAGGGMSAGAFFASLGWLAVFFLTVLVLGFILLPRLLRSVGKSGDDEALVLALLGSCFFVSYIAEHFNFSLALGAFLVGVVGASSDVRDRLARLVAPLKSMFAAVFFVSIGLLVDPVAMARCLPQIVVMTVVVIAGKFAANTFAGLLAGLSVRTSVQNGLALAQIGEFALMVAIVAKSFVGESECPLFTIAVGTSLLTTLLNPALIRVSGVVGVFAQRKTPPRVASLLVSYRAWLHKIGVSRGDPSFEKLRSSLIRLGVFAALMVSCAAVCVLLPRVNFFRISTTFERYDRVFFFLLSNVFSVSLLPMVFHTALSVGDAVSALLVGDGGAKWQVSARPVVRFVALSAVAALFFTEWTMINVAVAPSQGVTPYVTLSVIVVTGALGWRFFAKMGKRAATRLSESLSAEERREGLARTMTIVLPEGTISRVRIDPGSPAVGGTVVTLDIRAKTGASVVSVTREGRLHRNIGPEWEFREGDVLGVLGDAAQVESLRRLVSA